MLARNDNDRPIVDPAQARANEAQLIDVISDIFKDFPAHVRRANMIADTKALSQGRFQHQIDDVLHREKN